MIGQRLTSGLTVIHLAQLTLGGGRRGRIVVSFVVSNVAPRNRT
jgi:hypothetical protein